MANPRYRIRAGDGFFPLDNSAVFIASVTGKSNTYVYRLSCELEEAIFLPDLEASFDAVLRRFPAFRTELRPGFFWYYLEPLRIPARLTADSRFPAEYHRLYRWGRYLFRVRVYSSRISCEFHHALTDGAGALEFMKALVADYLSRRGLACDDWGGILRAGSMGGDGEYEDAYARIVKKGLPPVPTRIRAFNLPGRRYRGMAYRSTTGTASVEEALRIARGKGASLTELLAACHLYALQAVAEGANAAKRPICVQVPVNLRKHYPSSTLRNFFLCVSVDIDPRLGHYELDEILQRVRCQMGLNLTTKEMDRQILRNVWGETHLVSRAVPLPIKNAVLRLVSRAAARRYSGSISNLGPVKMPEAFSDRIKRFDILPSRNAITGANIVVVSWRDRLSITVGSLIMERDFEREFFRSIVASGISLTIDSNM
jgi:hypothetical protein